jgi:hypothetical protein
MGGSQRSAFEMVRNLAAGDHVIDEFIVRGTRAGMSRQAVEQVHAHWTWERTVERHEEAVRKVLNSRALPARSQKHS